MTEQGTASAVGDSPRTGELLVRNGPVGVVGATPTGADTRAIRRVVLGALGASVAAMVTLHVMGAGRLDPVRTTVSDYVGLPYGALLLAIAVLGVAFATATVLIGLVSRGAPNGIAWPFGLGCAGLLATIAFPTNVIGTEATLSTVLHRYAAALFFITLPIAALWARKHVPDRALTIATAVSIVVGVLFLLSHVPLLFPHSPVAPDIYTVLPRGIAERGLLLTDMALLAVLGRRVTIR